MYWKNYTGQIKLDMQFLEQISKLLIKLIIPTFELLHFARFVPLNLENYENNNAFTGTDKVGIWW